MAEFGGCWTQAALTHSRRTVKEYLLVIFQRRITGVGYDIEWPPRSPYFTSCDFFMWGSSKMQGLHKATYIVGIDATYRAQVCIDRNGIGMLEKKYKKG